MEKGIIDILEKLPLVQNRIHELRETILANLVMIGEIPAPTFQEAARVEFLVNRFTESGLQNCSTDEVGNALGILPGRGGNRDILLVAHLDSEYDGKVDHSISVQQNSVSGPAVGDNALGAAALASLPFILEQLDIGLDSNLVLMGSSRSLGRGDIEGLRFFLGNSEVPITHGICVEGVMLGRISYSSIGLMRCEISYKVPEEYDWTRFGAVGAIVTLNEVMNRILEIPLPRRPRTSIVLGSIRGGAGYDTIATEASLRFEIRSESAELVASLSQRIGDIAAEVSANSGAEVAFNIFAQRKPGGIQFAHPLAVHALEIMKSLDIKPRISPSTSELSAFIDRGIPAVAIGLTNADDLGKLTERIAIEPIYTGIAQLIGLILAIDKGYCDEPE
ncbi:MAG TPA: peptidase [Spirochaetia bacterium]|nr:peptidase [Spirochaetia bacterium]